MSDPLSISNLAHVLACEIAGSEPVILEAGDRGPEEGLYTFKDRRDAGLRCLRLKALLLGFGAACIEAGARSETEADMLRSEASVLLAEIHRST